ARIRTANIKETADGTLIYFPFNSTQKLNNAEVESYLNDVAERVNKSGESISLTGHTDDVGSDASNILLGRKRADIVKSYLVAQGVSVSKINVDSKGESMPVAENTTDEGRAKNRRTELKIIK
ncbi:MAG: OmpA family protein, partial [Saprospiraceae bacterium]